MALAQFFVSAIPDTSSHIYMITWVFSPVNKNPLLLECIRPPTAVTVLISIIWIIAIITALAKKLEWVLIIQQWNITQGEQIQLQFVLPTIIRVCISLPFGKRTWLNFSVVETISEIVMSCDLPSCHQSTPRIVHPWVHISEITHKSSLWIRI